MRSGVYYLRFVERETSYFSDRNARLIVGLAAQLRESVDATSEYAKQAAGLPKDQVPWLFRFDPAAGRRCLPRYSRRLRRAQRRRRTQTPATAAATLDRPHRYAERTANGLVLHFNHVVKSELCGDHPKTGSVITKINAAPSLVTSSVDLSRLADKIVQQSAAAVFASVFILDATGTVAGAAERTKRPAASRSSRFRNCRSAAISEKTTS